MARLLLIHGAATTGAIWDPLLPLLPEHHVEAPTRPSTGDIEAETQWLASICAGALVIGMSGGATLALALAARPNNAAGVLAHEPAVGSLLPELLLAPSRALQADGVPGFGAELYGDRWHPDMAPAHEVVARDLEMFRSFEPQPAVTVDFPALVSTGSDSPELRHLAAARLHSVYGYATTTVPGTRHFVAQESPAPFAALVQAMAAGLPDA